MAWERERGKGREGAEGVDVDYAPGGASGPGLASSAGDDGAGPTSETVKFSGAGDPDGRGQRRRPRMESRTSSAVERGGCGGRRAIRPVQRQVQRPAVRMLDDHVAMALVIPLQPHHCQRHPVEGMDRQGDGHPLRRDVLTRCSVMWSWASSPPRRSNNSSGSNTSSRVPSRQAVFRSSATRPSLRSRSRSCAKGGRRHVAGTNTPAPRDRSPTPRRWRADRSPRRCACRCPCDVTAGESRASPSRRARAPPRVEREVVRERACRAGGDRRRVGAGTGGAGSTSVATLESRPPQEP